MRVEIDSNDVTWTGALYTVSQKRPKYETV